MSIFTIPYYISSMAKLLQNTAAATIRALAEHHHVRYRQIASDVFGDDVTRLAGDYVQLDEPGLLLLALRRAGYISKQEATRLHGDYLRAKYE
jgi:hypothetical protein